MCINIFEGNTVGYKNVIKSSCSQDFSIYKKYKDYLICSVADGHSMDMFKYSHIGSRLACKAILDISEKYLQIDSDLFINNFKKGIIQKQIKLRWRNLVYEDFYSRNYRAYKLNYGLYGTTLTFFILLRDKMIFFNLGDGNILIQQENGYNFIFENNNYRVVNSLAHENCEDKMQYKILNRYKDLKLAIFTDGFINCFNTYEEVKSDLDSTFEMLNKNIFRRYNLENKYKAHLEKLSRYGSHDDISVIFVLQNNAKL